MANPSLFKTLPTRQGSLPSADTRNEAGGIAYTRTAQAALAQYAATGCLNATYYATAQDQLAQILNLTSQVSADFIARTALYCREKGFMKDTPALLCAILATRDGPLLERIFDRVIDDAKMLRNFVQILRSGATGRKSLGTLPKRLVRRWLESRSDENLFRSDVGQSPSLADIIKMVHPKPRDAAREALLGYLIGRPHQAELLPPLVRQYEAWKLSREGALPDIPFQRLTALTLQPTHWKAIARRAPWQMTRMNLNTFARHGVFEDAELTLLIADRLRDAEKVKRARVFPYQLLMAYISAGEDVPLSVRAALQDAMEIAIANVPQISGQVYVCPDISGSMHSAVTGYRSGSTSAVTCLHVATLVAASVLRKNPSAQVLPFSDTVVPANLNPCDSVMTNTSKLMALPSGGTNCSAPLALLNSRGATGDLVILVSDNMSWVDTWGYDESNTTPTRTMIEWQQFKKRNPQARLVCLDIQPYQTTQGRSQRDILNVGGFSDQVFEVIDSFAEQGLSEDHWVSQIQGTPL